ncbi:MAG: hypothetical protein OER90_04665 [Gemmatimonadota bacterium]|nr:hypothetical protein [Gemmatimonadota bacterium]
MPVSVPDAFAALYAQLAPTPADLVSGTAEASVFETFKDVKAAARPERIAGLTGDDYSTRGLLAHALFLDWRGRREAQFLLDRTRHHMMTQLRDEESPHPDLFRLLEALTRFCDAWKHTSTDEE